MATLALNKLTADDGVLKVHGRSFYWASFFLPPKARKLAAALYAFCRWVDDAVDEAESEEEAVRNVEVLEKLLKDKEADETNFRDLFVVLRDFGLGVAPAQELILGVKSDLQEVAVADEEELLLYCYRVAGTVGLMMCPVLGVRDPVAWRYAIDLGIAMQLTNISRDVLEDANRERTYIPQSWFNEGIDPDDILHNERVRCQMPPRVNKALALADTHYESAISGMVYIPWRARLAICIALTLYREIGVKIRRKWDGNSLLGRMYVTPVQKVFCLFKGLAVFCSTVFRAEPGKKQNVLMKHASLRMLPGVKEL